MDEELNPCPFCGGKAELDYWYRDFSSDCVNVVCTECGARSAEFNCDRNNKAFRDEAEKKAIKSWNRRIIIAE